jgi:hypothetical protein
MSYSLGAFLTPAQVNKDMGWTKSKLKSYWDARAKACQGMADEGACLAQVARHVPVTFAGLGQSPELSTLTSVVDTSARLIRDPEGLMRAQGPQIVSALDRHVVNPLVDRMAQAAAPYMVRYVVPPLAVLYVISGLGAFYSFQSLKTLREGKRPVSANKRRRRRR